MNDSIFNIELVASMFSAAFWDWPFNGVYLRVWIWVMSITTGSERRVVTVRVSGTTGRACLVASTAGVGEVLDYRGVFVWCGVDPVDVEVVIEFTSVFRPLGLFVTMHLVFSA